MVCVGNNFLFLSILADCESFTARKIKLSNNFVHHKAVTSFIPTIFLLLLKGDKFLEPELDLPLGRDKTPTATFRGKTGRPRKLHW